MQIVIDIDEARFKDIQRIAEVQLESNHFKTAEQIIANGTPIEQEPKTDILDKIKIDIINSTLDYPEIDLVFQIIDRYRGCDDGRN